jgi:transcriptional regulator with XRE-family HTH domain
MKKTQEEKPLTFGEFFRQRRIALGFTLRSFCERYSYDPGNISRLERNILSPSIDTEKLAGYATALKVHRDSEEWTTFFDLAHTAKGKIPNDLLKSPNILSILPAFYRTARGEKLNREKIKKLIKLINNANNTEQ